MTKCRLQIKAQAQAVDFYTPYQFSDNIVLKKVFHRKAKPATRQDRRASLGIHGPHRAAELTTTPSATRNHLLKYGPQVPPVRRTSYVYGPCGDVVVRTRSCCTYVDVTSGV